MSTDSPSTTDRPERYSLDEIRAYLAGPTADDRQHEDIDRMAWLLGLHDTVRDQLHRVADENRVLRERLDTAAALHKAEYACGNVQHTNPQAVCPECETVCEHCGYEWPCATTWALGLGEGDSRG